MLIDDVKIEVAAGHGGKGCVGFNKNLMSLGPAGGSGGKGGSVISQGVSDLNALGQFRYKKQIDAPNGRDGKGQFCDGPDGKDLIVKVPVGTVIYNLDTEEDCEITKVDQKITIAKGEDHPKELALGACAKFFWAKDTSGYHFIADDDILYPNNYVAYCISKIEQYNRTSGSENGC